MSALSERLTEQDLDALARVLHAVRQRRLEREQQQPDGNGEASHGVAPRDEAS